MNGQHPLIGAVAQICHDAATTVEGLSNTATARDAATLIRAEVRNLYAGAAVCVVVGETKRGKSSVINALIGERDVLPVEADVATATYIEVRHGERVSARVHLKPSAQVQELESVTEVEFYAAVDPETQQPRRDDVDRVEIRHPAAVLENLCLVDTPGVGGLDAGHRAITLAALSRADLLLFVVNGARELTRSELAFLTAATERVASVLFVLTQADRYPAWQETFDRNRALLAEHSPRYTSAPWFVVSSLHKMDADEAARGGDTATADRLRATSGFDALTAALVDGVAGHAQELRLGNALHVAGNALVPALTASRRRLRALTQDPLVVAEIQQLQEQLTALEQQDAAWQTGLRHRARQLTEELTLGFRRSLNDLRAHADEQIAGGDPQLLTDLPADLTNRLHGIWLDLQQHAEQGFSDIVVEIAGHFPDLDTPVQDVPELPERLRTLPEVTRTTHDQTGFMAMVERLGPASRSGALAFTFLAVVTGGTLIPAVAGIWIARETIMRRDRREELTRARGDAKRYVSWVMSQAQTEIPAQVKSMVDGTVRSLTDRVANWIVDERRVLEADLAENRRSHDRTATDLAERRERLTAAITAAETILTRAHELQRGLGNPVTDARLDMETGVSHR